MAKNSIVKPLVIGGVVLGSVWLLNNNLKRLIKNSDDTSGFISGVTGSYIDEPSNRVILTDLRQSGRTDRVIYRQDTFKDVAENAFATGQSIWNRYIDFKQDKLDTKENIKTTKSNNRTARQETRQENRTERQENRQEARITRQENRIEARENKRTARQETIKNVVSKITSKRPRLLTLLRRK